ELADLVGMDGVLVMNTGAEAVETAIKAARRWAYDVKGIQPDRAEIITAAGCFHGRTTTIVGMSSDPDARRGFGPFTPGFRSVAFGRLEAVESAIGPDTAAVLVEPIQGEAGVVIPPPGYLAGLRRLCDRHAVLLILDEIQSGLGRTGATLACDQEGVRPDVLLLGKALGGGIVPLSAVLARRDVIGVFTPGSHGSTFGGNPLACAIGREVVAMLRTGEPQRRAAHLGRVLARALSALDPATVGAIRCQGLWAGVDLARHMPDARAVSEEMMARRVLVKDTHARTLRIAPPITISEEDLGWAMDQLTATLELLGG
ncbi:MAG: aspartate aminotransferase family protein, partial [Acidimicrobiales bacterium]